MCMSVSVWQGEIDSRKENFMKIREKGEVSIAVHMSQYHMSRLVIEHSVRLHVPIPLVIEH